MRVKTLKDVHVRAHHPRRTGRPKGVVFEGFVIEIAREVSGESIDGNARWYQDRNGDFIWSGGTTRIEEIPVTDIVAEAEEVDKLSIGQKKLSIPEIWKKTRGEGVKVAVLDSGIDRTHPEFKQAIAEGTNTRSPAFGVEDSDGHGTHCAGIIGARGHGEVIGVAPACKLYPVKVINGQTSPFKLRAFLEAMSWAVQKRVDVISISLGTEKDTENAILAAVEHAVQANIIVVAAIGNDGDDPPEPDQPPGDFPAVHPECISVGALNDDLTLDPITSRFPNITLCAPGRMVKSTWVAGRYEQKTGTSMAAPFVAGVAALLKSKRPAASPREIRKALVDTALVKEQGGLTYRVIQPLKAFNAL